MNNDLQYCMLKLSQSSPELLRSIREVLDGRGKQQDVLLPKHEAAKMLSVSRSTLWRFLKSGVLPIVDLNGIERIRLSDVQRLITAPMPSGETITSSKTTTKKSKSRAAKRKPIKGRRR